MLFGKLGLPSEGLKKTQAGSISTAADVLEGLRGKHEIVDLILEQRQLSKLLSTYVDALPTMVNPRTGRLHTSFNQGGAETGRISSSAPEPAEHPDPHRCRAGDPPGVRGRAGLAAALGRLLAGRAAHPGPHLRGRVSAGGLRPR